MTSGLRKAHKYIWLLLIIIVPVIIFLSIKDLNVFSSDNNTVSSIEPSKKNHLKTIENDILKIALYKNSIDAILKKTLKHPTSIVYELNNDGSKGNAIGQLTTAGIYKFNINNLPKGIILYDDLKHVEITKLQF
ncbi:hypothetical protein GCM10023311_05790 [Flaviramulus aquimarinus]|uniref:Uncharacterized protein n=1 Tax=Flaviramulus aquimarinus TaxID=1170456 RepID=A0ABP9EUG8_9FLAO